MKRKTEACLRCWSVGHRADRMPLTGSRQSLHHMRHFNPSPPHTCHPRCIICSGPRPTGEPACPQRYRRPPTTRRRIIVDRDNPAFSAPQGNPLGYEDG
ncbi:hypothetical protein HPB48_011226 [Haemaphysalis longicornis]|uniref:Uncharacterized protein n=1 Tax=Haemaphysalis longicornis TaxID=44386 RepID=A0A9J6G7N5_HAELO|nr:hypothetical protein HPB48_011226 [Haemaphysalis longicornis]